MAALCASRWSAIGCLDSRTKNLSMKERPRANCASRWSAVGRTVATTKKKGLTRAGLLMEVADDPTGTVNKGIGLCHLSFPLVLIRQLHDTAIDTGPRS